MKTETVKETTTENQIDFKEVGQYRIQEIPQDDKGPNAGRVRASRLNYSFFRTDVFESSYAFGDTEQQAINNVDDVVDLNRGRQALVNMHSLLMQSNLVHRTAQGQLSYEDERIINLARKLTKLFEESVVSTDLVNHNVFENQRKSRAERKKYSKQGK